VPFPATKNLLTSGTWLEMNIGCGCEARASGAHGARRPLRWFSLAPDSHCLFWRVTWDHLNADWRHIGHRRPKGERRARTAHWRNISECISPRSAKATRTGAGRGT